MRKHRVGLFVPALLFGIIVATESAEDAVSLHALRSVSLQVTPSSSVIFSDPAFALRLKDEATRLLERSGTAVTEPSPATLVLTVDPLCSDEQPPTCAYHVEVALREPASIARNRQIAPVTTWHTTRTGLYRGGLPSARQAMLNDVLTCVERFAVAAAAARRAGTDAIGPAGRPTTRCS